jgi:hypothetical protein
MRRSHFAVDSRDVAQPCLPGLTKPAFSAKAGAPRPLSPFSTVSMLLYHERPAPWLRTPGTVALEQSQGAGRRYGVSARLYGELDEDAFDVGLHGLRGNLQLLSDTFVGKSEAHRAQDAVFARTQ